jgi:hypothetical protein
MVFLPRACLSSSHRSRQVFSTKPFFKKVMNKLHFTQWVCVSSTVLVIGALTLGSRASAEDMRHHRGFNEPGNILIADQFNNRVIETDPDGNILWSYGLGPNVFSDKTIVGVNDAERVGPFTLMAGTGTPAGVIPQAPNGVADNRVILVDQNGHIVWQYGKFGQSGSGPDLLNTPVQCTFLPNTDILITDQANNRIIEVNLFKRIVCSIRVQTPLRPIN